MSSHFKEHRDGTLQFWRLLAFSFVAVLIRSPCAPIYGQQHVPMVDPPTRAVELSVIEITPRYDGESYQGRFRLNNQDHKINVFGRWTSPNGIIDAFYVRGETFAAGAWKAPTVFSDMIPLAIPVEAGENVEVVTSLPFVEQMGSPLKARIRWSDIVSDPFVLDWQADRKAGKFAFAKSRHIETLRRLLRRAGFQEQFLRQDDFWSELVRGLEARVSKAKGFTLFSN